MKLCILLCVILCFIYGNQPVHAQHSIDILPPIDHNVQLLLHTTRNFDFLNFNVESMPGSRLANLRDGLSTIGQDLKRNRREARKRHTEDVPSTESSTKSTMTQAEMIEVIRSLRARIVELEKTSRSRVSTLSVGSGSNLCSNNFSDWHNHTQCDDYPKFECPPESDSCNRINHAFQYNYCINRTVDYRDAPDLQLAFFSNEQRDRLPRYGRPGSASTIGSGVTTEPVQTLWAFGNAGGNNWAPYNDTGTKPRSSGVNIAYWMTLADSSTNVTGGPSRGGGGWWIGLVKNRVLNDLLLPFCKNITKTFRTADPLVARIHEVNTPGCPICFSHDVQCVSMNNYGDYMFEFGSLDTFTISPPFLNWGPNFIPKWDHESGYAAGTGVYANWVKTGRMHLHTQPDRGDYVYEDCPRHDSTRTVPVAFKPAPSF